MRKRKHYLGIDPGIKGGLCIIDRDGTAIDSTRMPDGTIKIIEWIMMVKELYPNLIMVAEKSQAMPKQGIVSAFRYGQHFGMFEVAAIFLKLPYHEVRPTIWKKSYGLSSSKMDSTSVCRRLFPTVDLIPQGCRKESDGIAEALLIAEWARRKNL